MTTEHQRPSVPTPVLLCMWMGCGSLAFTVLFLDNNWESDRVCLLPISSTSSPVDTYTSFYSRTPAHSLSDMAPNVSPPSVSPPLLSKHDNSREGSEALTSSTYTNTGRGTNQGRVTLTCASRPTGQEIPPRARAREAGQQPVRARRPGLAKGGEERLRADGAGQAEQERQGARGSFCPSSTSRHPLPSVAK